MEDKITFFKSFYMTFKKLETNDEKAEYIEGLLGFAFEGIEPDFEEGSNLDFAFTNQRDNIEASRKRAKTNRENGRQHIGSNTDNPSDKRSDNPSINPKKNRKGKVGEPIAIQDKDRDKDKEGDMDKEGERSFSSEKKLRSPATADGADAGRPAPPSVAVCPLCGSPLSKTGISEAEYWWCDGCSESFAEGKAAWEDAA